VGGHSNTKGGIQRIQPTWPGKELEAGLLGRIVFKKKGKDNWTMNCCVNSELTGTQLLIVILYCSINH
jgi:hypothetical protein